MAASSESIIIDEPATGAGMSNPMTVSGRTRSSGGELQFALYAHGQTEPIVTGIITAEEGGFGRFSAIVEWPDQPAGPGTLRLFTVDRSDGSVEQTTVIPVRL